MHKIITFYPNASYGPFFYTTGTENEFQHRCCSYGRRGGRHLGVFTVVIAYDFGLLV
ncbi:TPA: hypothetical protein O8U07_003007 [Enterobacter kobei]|nr:hypothetical protein [Enterobacter kobei]